MTTAGRNIARLSYLRDMMSKYAGAYDRGMNNGRGLSSRMYSWIDEYDSLRYGPGWAEYCKANGYSTEHDAADNFA